MEPRHPYQMCGLCGVKTLRRSVSGDDHAYRPSSPICNLVNFDGRRWQ